MLAEKAQHDLFRHSRRQGHCLNHLYTVKHKSSDVMQLRQRGHNFQLPTIKYEFNKRNFIIRSLFDYVWCQFIIYHSICHYNCFIHFFIPCLFLLL